MRALAFLLGLTALAASASAATGASDRDQPKATAPAKLAKATGPISRLTSTRITVAKLTCGRSRTSPPLRGLGVGARVAISCRGGKLTKVTDLRPPKPVTGTLGGSTAAPATTTPVAPPPPASCPDVSFQVPSVLTLSAPGLTKVVDPPHVYPVTGNNLVEIHGSISRCRPAVAGRYDAVTRYSFNYSYVSTRQPNGLCRLTRIAVGMHVAVAIPGWSPGPDAAPGLAEAWQSYIAATTLHEQGHVDLDLQWAQQLLDTLGALGESGCDTIGTQVSALATKAGVGLVQANVDYDTATNHGVTQGATVQMP